MSNQNSEYLLDLDANVRWGYEECLSPSDADTVLALFSLLS